MYAFDKDALLCDLAETYGIYDMQALPVSVLAALAFGLSPDSRIKRKLSGRTVPESVLLLAAAVDRLSILVWQNTVDGHKGRNKPVSIVEQLTRGEEKPEEKPAVFDSPEAFMAARANALRGG